MERTTTLTSSAPANDVTLKSLISSHNIFTAVKMNAINYHHIVYIISLD
jgi:hypothetical protein